MKNISPAPATPPVTLIRKTALSGNKIDVRVEREGGEVVRQVNAEVNLPNLLATVFATTRRDRGEVPFAFGVDGQLFTPTPDDRAVIESLGEEGARRQQHPRRAEPALHGAVPDERLLQRIEPVAVGEPLDGEDGAAVDLHGEVRTGAHRGAVDEASAAAMQRLLDGG